MDTIISLSIAVCFLIFLATLSAAIDTIFEKKKIRDSIIFIPIQASFRKFNIIGKIFVLPIMVILYSPILIIYILNIYIMIFAKFLFKCFKIIFFKKIKENNSEKM